MCDVLVTLVSEGLMQRIKTVVLLVVLAVFVGGLTGCNDQPDPWFGSDLEEAFAEAGKRRTLVMVDFMTDWCSWCKRLDKDTFSDASVVEELGELVALRLDAEKEGVDAAERYGVRSYPTIIFLDAAGHEVDRILGYLPPDAFLAEVQRIRAGDTFNACLARLNEEPSNLEALERAVEGLLERSDAAAAMKRVEDFHASHDGDEQSHIQCQALMFTARSALNESLYRSAARLYRRGWPEVPEVPDAVGAANLLAMVSGPEISGNDREELRAARLSDGQELVDTLDLENLGGENLLDVAGFAFRAGLYQQATQLYRRWFDTRQVGEGVNRLNQVAWNLYLMNGEPEAAIAMAQEAYDIDREPGVGDTLARLLYVTGKVDEAIEIQTLAAEASTGGAAEEYAAAVETMRSGDALEDHPGFDDYPGEKRD